MAWTKMQSKPLCLQIEFGRDF